MLSDFVAYALATVGGDNKIGRPRQDSESRHGSRFAQGSTLFSPLPATRHKSGGFTIACTRCTKEGERNEQRIPRILVIFRVSALCHLDSLYANNLRKKAPV